MGNRQSLGAHLEDKANGLNGVRLLAAMAVVLSHSYYLVTGNLAAQPFSWGPYDLGGLAVNVFFVLSGLLLARSYDMNPSWKRFVAP